MKNIKKGDLMKKVCLISSSGGHYEELMKLKPLEKKYIVFVVTEKTKYNNDDPGIDYYLYQTNRREILCFFKIIINLVKSFVIFLKEKPDVIISTGVLSTIPMLFIGHIFKKKIIYIESIANVYIPTRTGRFIYKMGLADRFYVQWKSLLKHYPTAIYEGRVY